METVKDKDITATNDNIYLFYGAAKQAGLKPGDEFTVENDPANACFRILAGYVNWIPEQNRKFSGYRVEEIRQ
jgi:5-enolpyruvylshikimate-3-phosphate synthase